MDKLSKLFGDNYERDSEGNVISVGKDKDGNDIKVNINPEGGLQISPEVLAKINDPEWVKANIDKEKAKRSKILDNYFKNTVASGPLAKDFERKRQLFDIPKEFAHMLVELEDDDEDLDNQSRGIIKRARQNSTVVEPDFMKGISDTIKYTLNYKNMIQVNDFLKYIKMSNVDFSVLNYEGAVEFFKKYKALRRPSIALIIQRLISETDEIFLKWLKDNEVLDEETKKILRINIPARMEFIKHMEHETGSKLFTMDDFIIQKFHFQEYGLVKEDGEWFNRNKLVPGLVGVTMGQYFDQFKERTGFDYEDVYYYYWKIVEEENKEKEKAETLGEDYDQISLSENEKELNNTVETPETLKIQSYGIVYDDDDII